MKHRSWVSAVTILTLAVRGAGAADAAAAGTTAPTLTVGKLTISGAKYEGEIRDAEANGKGTLTFPDGRKYVGEFKDDRRNGPGVWAIGGFKYEGGWQDDRYHGQGTETYPRGPTYTGEFRDGLRCGQGTMTFPDGRKYEGSWKRNLFHGQGTLTARDGKQQAGRWELGEYRGPTEARPANAGGADLPAAVQKLGADDPVEARAARTALLAAGDAGKVHLEPVAQDGQGVADS